MTSTERNSEAKRLRSLSAASLAEFVAALGGIFENSPWVAEGVWAARPFDSLDALHRAMLTVVTEAGRARQLALIRAHPELAGKEAATGGLTADSAGEQASAGLDRCSPPELQRLRELNGAYRARFGFPFVMAVKGRDKAEVLRAMETRLQNDADTEFQHCLSEIGEIARLRLKAMFAGA